MANGRKREVEWCLFYMLRKRYENVFWVRCAEENLVVDVVFVALDEKKFLLFSLFSSSSELLIHTWKDMGGERE